MIRKIIAPLLLFISGIINLFPKTSASIVDFGYGPITIQTIIGLIAVILAIALLSAITFSNNGDKK
ncbi:MAG: hypothetical protein UT11_C0051G0008 [Berkelbacteria bacterium GW2011_GWA2_38_9]|uniref:Uncharacterized protein n=1 Tax=Berkelbacteria bacterium GW2011_GWA2_38_9 TaxID=1618334 RepID=A0A0G0LHT6_9BACT|nr:MAG: hypothetical protein UT11_C0051G0008 [Berkelbacteria bacterium GW2011_GWA2_38_9]